MSLTRELVQEDLSVAYISAVAAKAGYDCERYGKHDYGVDLQIIPIVLGDDGRRFPGGKCLLIQVKASHNFSLLNDNIYYDIDVKNYNDLIEEKISSPFILVLYCMPCNENEWLKFYDDSAVLKHKGYWVSLRGKRKSKNKYKKRINIPLDQEFTDSALISIMKTIEESGQI